MTDNHSEHFTLIASNVFNAEDIGETLDAIEQIYGSEYGPYDKGKVGFYVSQIGYENIEKVVERGGSDRDYEHLVYSLLNIPSCYEGKGVHFSKCNDMGCLDIDEISEYSSCKGSLVYISSARDTAHECEGVAAYPVEQYTEKYSHRRIIQQKLDGLNIANSLLDGVGKAFMNIVFANGFFNGDVFETSGDKYEICRKVFKHICVIDDYASNAWSMASSSDDIKNTFISQGVIVAPESSNGHKDKKYMRNRNISFSINGIGVNFVCEWHSKITREKGRIYFYVPSDSDTLKYPAIKGKVLVGKICKHL
jgi:hypothetical protein